jgi:hypothetical protein
MNGLDIRIQSVGLVLKHCRVHSVQFSIGSVQCCINISNEVPCGGTFLVFKELSEAECDAAFSGIIRVWLLSERRGNVGVGTSANPISLNRDVYSLLPSSNLTDTFTVLSGIDTKISLQYQTEGKPDIELGDVLVSLRLYSLALVKECPHKCVSPVTEKERWCLHVNCSDSESSSNCFAFLLYCYTVL